jgi:hypothetical protein
MKTREAALWVGVLALTLTGCQALGALWATPSSGTYVPPPATVVSGEVPLGPNGEGGTVVVAPGVAPQPGNSMGEDLAMGAGGILGLLTGNPALGALGASMINILGARAAQKS